MAVVIQETQTYILRSVLIFSDYCLCKLLLVASFVDRPSLNVYSDNPLALRV